MYGTRCVLALLALYVGLAYSFSWDIVVARANRLEFYNDGTRTNTATPSSYNITWISYDPVHDRVLYADQNTENYIVFSFDIATNKTQNLLQHKLKKMIKKLAYDPVTDLLFVSISRDIYSVPLKPGIDYVNRNLVIKLEVGWPGAIAVDSCEGYIYWIAYGYEIERARFNGSDKKTMMGSTPTMSRQGLTIDQQTKKLYWVEFDEFEYIDEFTIMSTDLKGGEKTKVYIKSGTDSGPNQLTISKDFIYWGETTEMVFWQLPKNTSRNPDVKPTKHSMTSLDSDTFPGGFVDIAANYKVEEQTRGIKDCKALTSVLSNENDYARVFCIHGTKVSGESRCECTQGYTGERCDVLVCQNYCFQGNCSLSAEGQPKCRCNAGYSGERCEINACHEYCLNSGVCSLNNNSEPVCQCTGHYEGERCEAPVCQSKYCIQGDCSVSAEGQPQCRCNAGYSGERCEINACHGYCSNNGVCSLNNNSEPVCQCTSNYNGERCDIPLVCLKCFQTVSMMKVILNSDVTPANLRVLREGGVKSTCASTVA